MADDDDTRSELGEDEEFEKLIREQPIPPTGYNTETTIALLGREVIYLTRTVRGDRRKLARLEQTIDELKSKKADKTAMDELSHAQQETSRQYNNLIVRGTTIFGVLLAIGGFFGWVISVINNAKGALGK